MSTWRRFVDRWLRQGAGARQWVDVDRLLDDLAALPERTPLEPEALVAAVHDLVAATPPPDPACAAVPMAQRLARMRTVCRRLLRQNKVEPAAELLALVLPAWDPDPTLGLHALAAHAATSRTGQAPEDLGQVVGAALTGADRALAAGDAALSAELVVIGAGLLLHRDLHADVPHSPLVDDPATFLAPLRASAALRALAAPRTQTRSAQTSPDQTGPDQARPAQTRPDQAATRRRRVVVLPGAYPRFAQSLVAELRARPDLEVQVVELGADRPAYRWLGTDPELVRLRLAGEPGPWPTEGDQPFAVAPEQLRAVQEADVVVADWADKGAVWASLVVPATTRLVIRAHGMDSFGLWPHVIDWSRVATLVSVSPHQARALEQILRHSAVGAVSTPPPCHPVPNLVRLPEVADPPARDTRALVLVGWGSRVKDPLWAVEVLAGLLARGGDWRLVLVGDGFRPGGLDTLRDYAAAFTERLRRPDVAGHVQRVPRTDDVAVEVARVGFVLSSSLRESFHQGLVEGVLGGAVPVVRNWPFFAGLDGARGLYPEEWVVEGVAGAVERIHALGEASDRAAAAEKARAEVVRRFDPARVGAELARIVLGEEPPAPTGR